MKAWPMYAYRDEDSHLRWRERCKRGRAMTCEKTNVDLKLTFNVLCGQRREISQEPLQKFDNDKHIFYFVQEHSGHGVRRCSCCVVGGWTTTSWNCGSRFPLISWWRLSIYVSADECVVKANGMIARGKYLTQDLWRFI